MNLRSSIERIDEMPLANAYLNLRYKEPAIEGIENLPPTGAHLIVSNHEHIDDSFLYYRMLVKHLDRTPRFAVNATVFEWPGVHGAIMREFLHAKRQIPVDRFDPRSAVALRRAMNTELDQGEIGFIFPEKTTPKTGYVHRFHTVAAQIAIDSQIPITPLHIAYTKTPGSVRRDVRIRIAAPLLPHDYNGLNRGELSTILQQRVANLGGQALSSEWAHDPTGYTSEWHSNRFVPIQ